MIIKNALKLTAVSALVAVTAACSEYIEIPTEENGWKTKSAEGMEGNIPNPCHMYYPNIPGELLLENEKMVVQKFTIQPGEWEGIHRHPYDQLYVQVKGGQWTVQYSGEESSFYAETGSASWDPTGTTMAELHQSGNTGDEPMELIWIGIKPGCLVPN